MAGPKRPWTRSSRVRWREKSRRTPWIVEREQKNEEWELKDADENWWYQWYKKQVDQYDADLNWKQTRHVPSLYEELETK